MQSDAETCAVDLAEFAHTVASRHACAVTAFQVEHINDSQSPVTALRALVRASILGSFRTICVAVDEARPIGQSASSIRIQFGDCVFPDKTWSLGSAICRDRDEDDSLQQ